MNHEDLGAEIRRLGSAATTLAAIGAALHLRRHELGDPQIRATLQDISAQALPFPMPDLTDAEAEDLLHTITVSLASARDILHDPMRGAGWAHYDPMLLKSQGLISRAFPRHFAQLAAERPDIAAAFSHRFLDIGVGVAALAVEAAEQFPKLHVTGIDIWEPSLALAREAVAASAHADRVEIKNQDVTTLDEPDRYSAVWFPILFFPRQVVEAAMPGVVAALRKDGLLIIPRPAPPPPGLPALLGRLQMLRNGGASWTDDELVALVSANGLVDVAFCPGPALAAMPGGRMLLARKP